MKDAKINDGTGTTQDSNGAVEQAINSTPGSVSYLAMSYMVGEKKAHYKQSKLMVLNRKLKTSRLVNIHSGLTNIW